MCTLLWSPQIVHVLLVLAPPPPVGTAWVPQMRHHDRGPLFAELAGQLAFPCMQLCSASKSDDSSSSVKNSPN